MKLLGTLKLSHQILFILLLIPVFLVVSLLYYSASQHVTIRNKPLEQLALSTSSTVAEKIDRSLNERYADVQAFAYNKLAVEALQKGESDTLLEKFMNAMSAQYKCYDLMMLCDLSGKVVALNTKDHNNKSINSTILKGKKMNDNEWFRSSIVVGGPVGGAYFSDFNSDEDLTMIYGNNGYGMDFSAPVRNEQGQIIGVWRNRVSWKEVAQQIRKESENTLQGSTQGSLILLMNKQGQLIDADKEDNILKVNIGKNNLLKHFDFEYAGININEDDYIYGWAESTGAFSYFGNRWKFLTLIPKVKFTDADIYTRSDWTQLMAFSLALLLVGVLLSLLFVHRFSKRINRIKQSIQKLSAGEPEMIEGIKSRDEIGEMSIAINILNENFKKMANFSNAIGQGNLSASFSPVGDKDMLGLSLLKMKKNIETSQQQLVQQKWVSDTLTTLGEILREQAGPAFVYQKAISFIAKSIHAYQAALFLVKPHQALPEIELQAGFGLSAAYLDMKPFLPGEGSVGQAIKDNMIIRLQDLPEDYSGKINSGLGEFAPTEVIVIPIHFNGQAIGAFEFSAFKKFPSTVFHLLEKSSEYLGSYVMQLQIGVGVREHEESI